MPPKSKTPEAKSDKPKAAETKTAKKEKKELDEDDIAFQQKKKQEEAALKAARDKGTSPATFITSPSSTPSILKLRRVRHVADE